MPIGNMLNGRDQYQAAQDEKGTWRILDCWHDAIKALDPDDDVPDDNEAVTILEINTPDITSSDIRNRIKTEKSIKNMVSPRVETFIRKKKIYK